MTSMMDFFMPCCKKRLNVNLAQRRTVPLARSCSLEGGGREGTGLRGASTARTIHHLGWPAPCALKPEQALQFFGAIQHIRSGSFAGFARCGFFTLPAVFGFLVVILAAQAFLDVCGARLGSVAAALAFLAALYFAVFFCLGGAVCCELRVILAVQRLADRSGGGGHVQLATFDDRYVFLLLFVPCLSGCHRHLPDVVIRDFAE